MTIIVSENGKNAKRIEESQFGLEDKLQKYIHDNPDAIPLYDIDQDTRLFIAAREFSTKSGPIDALGFDANGNIYVVETKLYKNPDKRVVVAQALDYGASLWRHSIDFDNFIVQLDNKCQKEFGFNFKEKYTDFFELDDASENFVAIRTNLAEGNIKFVVVMNKLHDALKDLVLFVNQNSKFDLYAVELEYYKHKSFEIIIPKLYGTDIKKDVVSTKPGPNRKNATTDDFWDAVSKNVESGLINQKIYHAIKKLESIYTRMTKQILGNVALSHVTYSNSEVVKMFFNDKNNKMVICLWSNGSITAYKYGRSGPQIDFLDAVLRQLVDKQLFEKTEGWLKGYDWYAVVLNKVNVTDKDIDDFLKITNTEYANYFEVT